jgi:glycosyltransferase involved in cell wall biosynthesis
VFALPKAIICNSDVVKQAIETYGVAAKKIVAIPAFSRQYLAFERVALSPELETFLSRHEPIIASYVSLQPKFFVESLLRSLADVANKLPNLGIMLIGGETKSDAANRMVENAGLERLVFQTGDLSHDQCMTVISRAHIFVRTPKSDGVSSSVLESLSLGVPVLASENGTRPRGVITFEANNAADLTNKIMSVWNRYAVVRSQLIAPEIEDTVEREASLLLKLAKPNPPNS